jgi:hypothetical protein
MDALNDNTLCAAIYSTDGTPEGPREVSETTVGYVEKNYKGLVLALPVQGIVTIAMCLASANEACDAHNRNRNRLATLLL